MKKILENEILNDEDLENVAGGIVREWYEIFQVLNQKINKRLRLSEMPDYLKKTYGIDAKIDADLTETKATQINTVAMVKRSHISKFWTLSTENKLFSKIKPLTKKLLGFD